jgi:hypothetical protein
LQKFFAELFFKKATAFFKWDSLTRAFARAKTSNIRSKQYASLQPEHKNETAGRRETGGRL